MEAGRELDALVAEKVMGWDVGDIFYDATHQEIMPRVPSYSTKIAASWSVVEKILDDYHGCPWPTKEKARRHHYGFRLEKHTEEQRDCEVWRCQFPEVTCAPPHEEMNDGVEAIARTAPLAICLAALTAVGCPVEQHH